MDPFRTSHKATSPSRSAAIAVLFSLSLVACERDTPAAPASRRAIQPALSAVPEDVSRSAGGVESRLEPSGGVGIAGTTLPFTGIASSNLTLWDIQQLGAGAAGRFFASNNGGVLFVEQGGAGPALRVNGGSGTVGRFQGNGQAQSATIDALQAGLGTGVKVNVASGANSNPGVDISHFGTGAAVRADARGVGSAGLFQVTQAANASPALDVANGGSGSALRVNNQNGGNSMPVVEIRNNGGGASLYVASGFGTTAYFAGAVGAQGAVVDAETRGGGPAVNAFSSAQSTAPAGVFVLESTFSTSPAVSVLNLGAGPGVLVDQTGAGTDIAIFQRSGKNQIRFDYKGRGFFNGGTINGGADVAETFEVEGRVATYEPGDVLAISTRSDRRVAKSAGSYSTHVIGVYATKPGVLLTERSIDDGMDDMVPVGVVGVIPTKVTAENGRIRRGDLLVSAPTVGHAMRADRRRLGFGMVIGKALEEFSGPGAGLIRVLVNVK